MRWSNTYTKCLWKNSSISFCPFPYPSYQTDKNCMHPASLLFIPFFPWRNCMLVLFTIRICLISIDFCSSEWITRNQTICKIFLCYWFISSSFMFFRFHYCSWSMDKIFSFLFYFIFYLFIVMGAKLIC